MTKKIYVLTLSPALDYILKFDDFKKGKTNRPITTDIYAAGKGIHVSMMLNVLNQDNESIIFINGLMESFFLNDLNKSKINYKKFNSAQNIRINLKIIDDSQTEASAKAPAIISTEIDKLKWYLDEVLTKNDVLIISGSSPDNLGNYIYKELGAIANKNTALLVIDSFGVLLLNSLTEKPFLIKPNLEELETTLNVKINNDEDLISAANKLIQLGTQNVLVSKGNKGAILITKDKVFSASIPKTIFKLNNAAGAGDSMLAGFIQKFIETNDFEKSFKTSILCGSATAYSERIADAKMIEMINKFENTINIKIIDK
ncbi:1-phosphofructokinase family hexose kinase [Spiroplasma endosymbiont of Labia minor]|uniref:1-phosphofructokinase family hexose kinase n=1 Tax=Spiroplasma endosymbiont of Labia minor TaxID=3066305 RepID=UPI0030D15CA5